MGGIVNGSEKLRSLGVPWYRDWVLAAVAGLVLGLDQLTKYLIRANLSLGEAIPSEGAVRLFHTYNTGAAFGLFRDQTLPLILASLVGIGILFVVYRNASLPTLPLRLCLGLQIGGAVGNLLDRVRMGHVTDFVDLGPWPVFNLADASIVIGLILLTWLLMHSKKEALPLSMADSPPADGILDLRTDLTTAPSTICPLCESPTIDEPDGRRCVGCGTTEWTESPEDAPRGRDHGHP